MPDPTRSRDLKIRVEFTSRSQARKPARTVVHTVPLKLVRPPVVLVHGMFHNPTKGWKTAPPKDIGHATMEQRLTQRGFRVFLVDYHQANGSRLSGPSHLRDNQKVVWSAPGGIKSALTAFRKEGFAVTQADVVGHSMGGLLARAYARGKWLPACKHCRPMEANPEGHADDGDWYRRSDNFGQGDIHRLITCCTPHHGSHLIKALMRYIATCNRISDPSRSNQAKSLLRLIELAYGVSSGAFADQAPGSAALKALGATPVPAHAIACVADPAVDYRAFNELYRWLFVTIYVTAPPEALRALFSEEDDAQARCAEALIAFHETHGRLREGVVQKFITALSGALISRDGDAQRRKEYDQALTHFCAALFEGKRNDGAVGERSALGGLSKPAFATTIPNTLHSFAAPLSGGPGPHFGTAGGIV